MAWMSNNVATADKKCELEKIELHEAGIHAIKKPNLDKKLSEWIEQSKKLNEPESREKTKNISIFLSLILIRDKG